MAALVDGADWERLHAAYKAHDETRELVIKRSRDLQKLAKQAIYSLHRAQNGTARTQLDSAMSIITNELLPIFQQYPKLRYTGSFTNALEEYAEAAIFLTSLEESRILKHSELPILSVEEYLGGLLDFTGELNRLAVPRATARDKDGVAACRGVVEDIYGRLMVLDLGAPSLRKKMGPLEGTLSKLNHMLYELSLAEASPLARFAAAAGNKEQQEQEPGGREEEE